MVQYIWIPNIIHDFAWKDLRLICEARSLSRFLDTKYKYPLSRNVRVKTDVLDQPW